MKTVLTHSPDETEALGFAWAQEMKSGWAIGLSGDLGAGKTQLVKGLARGLGFSGKVQSPTFALINEYSASIPVFHIDLYRLENPAQIVAAGLEEFFFHPHGITVIEWIERWSGQNPSGPTPRPGALGYRHVHLHALSETDREITYEDFSA